MTSAPVFASGNHQTQFNPSASETADQPETQLHRPVLLLVDDEPLIVDTLTLVLEDAGFKVLTACNGIAALEKVASCRPDYLLSDVLMPKMNGIELAIAIRQKHPSTRITLFSGQAGISDLLLDGRRRGFEFELLAKPLHPLKIIEHLRSGLG